MSCRNAATLWAAFCLVPTLALAQSSTAPVAPNPLFGSIGAKPAILYDGLSTKANKIFILSSFHPVEILVKLDKWTKIRADGNVVGWMENSFFGDKRFVQVIGTSAEIRAAPNGSASVIFEAQRSVVLESTGPASTDGWMPVRHRDGQIGFVRLTQVWGA
ncbi:MAG: SH3 domain-containing protein [Betaproteobacteria bacterium]